MCTNDVARVSTLSVSRPAARNSASSAARGAIKSDRSSRTLHARGERVVSVGGGPEELVERVMLFSDLPADALPELGVGVELPLEGVAHAPAALGSRGLVEAEIPQQPVGTEEPDPPAGVEPGVARVEQVEQVDHGLGVGVEQAFGHQDAVGAAVPLDLPLVGADHRVMGQALVDGARRQRVECGPYGVGVAVHTNAEVEPRVVVADEEPPVGGAGVDEPADARPDRVPEQSVTRRRTGGEVQIGPLGAGRERTAATGRRLGDLRRHRRRRAPHERDDQLEGALAIGTRRDELVGTGEQLLEHDLLLVAHGADEGVDAQGVVHVEGEHVVVLDQGDPSGQPPPLPPGRDPLPPGHRVALVELPQLRALDPPPGEGEHDRAPAEAGREGGVVKGEPRPRDALRAALGLHRGQESVDARRAAAVVVGAGQAG